MRNLKHYLFLGILAFTLLSSVAYASVFNSQQLAPAPVNGYLLQTNGATSTWIATSSLGIGVSTSSDQSLTIVGNNGIINVGHANSWTGLQTFNRAGNAAVAIGNSPQAVFNASSGLYGQLLFQSAGSNKDAIAWDSNGGMYYLAQPFFRHSFKIGNDEMLGVSNSGVIINGLGSGNNYTLDVRGSLGVSSLGAGTVPYIDSGGQFAGDTNNIQYGDNRFLGVNQVSPAASIHAGVITRTIADVSVFNGVATPISSGISLGFGNQSYSVWAERLVGVTNIFSSNPASINVSEPSVSDYAPSSMSVQETGGNGYDMSVDTPPSYATYSLYDSNGCYINSTVNASIGSWSSGSGNTDVSVTINSPNIGTPSSYYVVRNGSDGQSVGGSFTDSNNNWSGGATPPVGICKWAINLSWNSVTNAVDYIVANTTNTSYVNTSGASSIQDIGSWGGGTPTVTPTSLDDNSFISDGTTQLMKLGGKFGAFGVTPVSQQTSATELTVALQNLGWLQNSGAGSYDINVNSLTANIGTFNQGTFNSTLTANSTANFNGQATFNSSLIAASLFQAGGVVQFPLVSNITTNGTLNNVNTASLSTLFFTGTAAQTVTGFSNTGNGKMLFISNRATSTALTLKNENTGSATTSRIITPTGGDFLIAPNSGANIQYDNTSSRWRVLSMSLPISSDFNKIGIGTTTPLSSLAVQGFGGINPFAISSSTGNLLLTLSQAGNLGLGSSTPNALLSILGTGSVNTVDILGGTNASGNGSNIRIKAGTASSGSTGGITNIIGGDGGSSGGGGGALNVLGGNGGGASGGVGGNATLQGGTAGGAGAAAGGDGIVTGGTAAGSSGAGGVGGSAKIFGGTGGAGGSAGTGGNVYIYGGSPSSGTTLYGNTILGLTSGAVNQGNIGIGSSTPTGAFVALQGKAGTLDPFDVSSSTKTSILRVTSGSKVGVATTTPDSTLDLNGNFRLEGISAVTTASISGAIVGLGCDTATTSVDASVSSSTVFITTPQTFPGAGLFWQTYLSATGVITTEVCSDVTVTPTASTYNVRIIK